MPEQKFAFFRSPHVQSKGWVFVVLVVVVVAAVVFVVVVVCFPFVVRFVVVRVRFSCDLVTPCFNTAQIQSTEAEKLALHPECCGQVLVVGRFCCCCCFVVLVVVVVVFGVVVVLVLVALTKEEGEAHTEIRISPPYFSDDCIFHEGSNAESVRFEQIQTITLLVLADFVCCLLACACLLFAALRVLFSFT
ncbi:unnamed protein product [Polarella glacialis]|uniref:Uncharacterized protein n=1 Tax=Polarella glacialis TaxID=89957 RepID=A0A813K793_POLGL|nr:unnamed protein product [Polarella glacialis]